MVFENQKDHIWWFSFNDIEFGPAPLWSCHPSPVILPESKFPWFNFQILVIPVPDASLPAPTANVLPSPLSETDWPKKLPEGPFVENCKFQLFEILW